MTKFGEVPFVEAVALGTALDWPPLVIDEVLVKNGERYYHRDLFGHIAIDAVEWHLEERTAEELAAAFHHADKTRPETVALNPDEYRVHKGFELWTDDGTWSVCPVFADGALLNPDCGVHGGLVLVEGHTRLGLLRGYLERGDISAESKHRCWTMKAKMPSVSSGE